ncbi:MAG: FtsX-like permease family protein [Thermoanaerobaculia bacterium]|nr:FtsX-like permease family protein [Thermoanaerobaculia bacterium]
MELGPIFRSLVHNKARFWLIALEVALTLAIVANCVNWMLDLRSDFLRDTGFDLENILVVETEPWAPEFKDEEFVHATRESDLERLRAFSGVYAATAVHQVPLSGGGSNTGRKPVGSEMDTLPAPYFVVADQAIETFGVRMAAGRGFNEGDFDERLANEELEEGASQHYNVIVTRAMADAYFPDGDALGQQIQSDEGERLNTIVGIMEQMHNSWPSWDKVDWAMLIPGRPGSDRRMRYMVRAEPGAIDSLYTEVEELLLQLEPGRIVSVETLAEVKRDTYSTSHALIKMLGAVIALLIVVTSLGIVGLTSSAVTQRTRQIGVRRALGATKGDIVRYFLVENWLITGFGLVFGVGLTYGLNYGLVHLADVPKMDPGLLMLGVAMLWTTGVLAALAPALKATLVPPEVATRTV